MNVKPMSKFEMRDRLYKLEEDPFELSIERWKRIKESTFELIDLEALDVSTCALCERYAGPDKRCEECPIKIVTKASHCEGTVHSQIVYTFDSIFNPLPESADCKIEEFYIAVSVFIKQLRKIRKEFKCLK